MPAAPSDLLPRLEAFDGSRFVVFRFLDGRPQGRGQELEISSRPGTKDYTFRQMGKRGEPFPMMGFLYASPGTYGIQGAEAGVIDQLNELRGHQVLLYRPNEPTLVCVLLHVREVDMMRPGLFVDPLAVAAAPEDVDRMISVELMLVLVEQPAIPD